MTLDEIRKLFPITRKLIYLNHASVAPPSLRVRESIQTFLAEMVEGGNRAYARWEERIETEAKAHYARMIGGDPEEIAFLKNTTEGIAAVAQGLEWSQGDNVVSAELEFPSNALQWLNLESQGVETRFVPARDGRITPEDIERRLDERTRVVALSFVEFFNGWRNDLEAIGRLCRERGIYFCVDAIQGLGVLEVEVRRQCIDFLSCSGHKWLLGLHGTSGFYCRRDLLDRLKLRQIGWKSVRRHPDPLQYDLTPLPTAKRFEGGSENLTGIIGFDAAVQLLLEIGLPAVTEQVKILTDRIAEGLEERGYASISPREPGGWSGIICFRHPEISTKEIGGALEAADIHVMTRLDHVRVSPHCYNTLNEVEAFLSALP